MVKRSLIVIAALSLSGCNPIADDNRSAVSLSASFEGGTTDTVGFFSDVVASTTETTDDFFNILVESEPKNGATDVSDFYAVNFLAYDVQFTRPDGLNEPGVNVPFPLTLALGGSVAPGGSVNLNLLFVTKEMKLEAPLRALWFGDGKRIFATLHVTVFGRDRVNNAVSASASAPIIFEDLPG